MNNLEKLTKGLECCVATKNCLECPYRFTGMSRCSGLLFKDTMDYIKNGIIDACKELDNGGVFVKTSTESTE